MKRAPIFAFILLLEQMPHSPNSKSQIFGDNMVRQRGMKVPIYGWCEVGKQVLVEFMGKTNKTIPGADGIWLVKLGSYKAGGPYTMSVKGKASP